MRESEREREQERERETPNVFTSVLFQNGSFKNFYKKKITFKACLGCCSLRRVLIKDKQLMDKRRVIVTI